MFIINSDPAKKLGMLDRNQLQEYVASFNEKISYQIDDKIISIAAYICNYYIDQILTLSGLICKKTDNEIRYVEYIDDPIIKLYNLKNVNLNNHQTKVQNTMSNEELNLVKIERAILLFSGQIVPASSIAQKTKVLKYLF
jgi:hypothetical protein